jgi:hypothetical protein
MPEGFETDASKGTVLLTEGFFISLATFTHQKGENP